MIWQIPAPLRAPYEIFQRSNPIAFHGLAMTKLLPNDVQWPAGAIFTVGHSNLPIEQFASLLKRYDIQRLADIRTVPRSRHNPQFNADTMGRSLQAVGIEYLPVTALGGLRHPRKDSSNTGWRNKSFRGYADYMQTEAFQNALRSLIQLGREKRTVMMCAEAVPWRCHRSLVADALNVEGVPAVEIMPDGGYRMHKLTPFARVEGKHIAYPSDQANLL